MSSARAWIARGARLPRWVTWLSFLVVGVVAVVLPWSMGASAQSTYVTMGLGVMVTVGLTLLMGFGGQISLGQAAFYMVGAYISGILAAHSVPTVLALIAAPVGTAALAAVIGVPLLRLRGNYLAFATLALQLIFLAVITNESGLTGGEIGLQGFPPLTIGGQLTGTVFAAVVWVLAMLSLLLGANLVASRPGRGLQAIAAGEVSAAAVGVPVATYKLRLFVISGAMAGLAGGLYAFSQQYLSTDAFPIILSVEFLVMAAVGGLGSIPGALVGAIVITLLQNELNSLGTAPGLPANAPQIFSLGIYGVLLIAVMLFFPRGLLPSAIAGARRLVSGAPPRSRPETPAP
ncbi:MAG: branched-chain amino acid ABC transporter permease [Solirubrobacteraceae bacterium]